MIESRLGPEELGPRLPVELGPLMTARVVSDLVAMAGFRAFEEDTGSEYPVVMPASGLASRLAENKHYYSVQLPGDPSRQILDTEWFEQARVLLAGTSFAADNGANALMLVLGRPVDAKTIPGADGLLPLADQLARAAAEPGRFRVLVWEFVERGIFTPSWRRPGRRVRW